VLFLEANPFASAEVAVYIADSCPVAGCASSSADPDLANWYNSGSTTATVYAVVKAIDSTDNFADVAVSIDVTTASPGDFCSGAAAVDLTATNPQFWTGDFSAFTDGFAGGTGCSTIGSPNPDVWFEVDVPADQWLSVTDASSTAMGIRILATCATNTCSSSGTTSASWQNTDPVNPATVYVVVEADGVSTGSIDLTFTAATVTIIEDFEATASTWPWAGWTYSTGPGTVTTAAAHDGSQGVVDPDWGQMFSPPISFGTTAGQILSTWVAPGSRAYIGFNADSSGARSFVVAPNTTSLIFQLNSGYGYADQASVSQATTGSTWYYVEIEYNGGGSYTGRLYASDGTTLINSLTNDYGSTSTAYGIAIRTFGTGYIDTISI